MELNELLEISVKQNASDLHISPMLPAMLRINGDLTVVEGAAPLTAAATKRLVLGPMSKAERDQFDQAREHDYTVLVPNVGRFRANAFHQHYGIAAVFRVVPEKAPTLEQLHLPPVLQSLLNLPNGLILVTGPTGSGKSTTLAAMVDHINVHQTSHIITIEDPIEFVHSSKKSLVNQRQAGRDTAGFSNALRSALRQDPDVILVGEMRDLETIRLALTAAETGHLVMATLHTSSAPRTINRIVDVFPTGEKNIIRNMLSESLQAVICQTLVKKISGGRVAAVEVMLGTAAVRNLIREDKTAQMNTVIQTGSEFGMCTLDQYLQRLVGRQIISVDAAREAAMNKDLFKA